MEAVLMWCEKRGIDVEYAGGIIRKHRKENVVLRVAIEKEAEDLNCLKRNVA
jgi:hypothetical protein